MMVDMSPELGTFPQLHSSDALVGAAALANGAGCAATSGCSAAEAGESVSTVDDKTRTKRGTKGGKKKKQLVWA